MKSNDEIPLSKDIAIVNGDIVEIISDDYWQDDERGIYGKARLNKNDVIKIAILMGVNADDLTQGDM